MAHVERARGRGGGDHFGEESACCQLIFVFATCLINLVTLFSLNIYWETCTCHLKGRLLRRGSRGRLEGYSALQLTAFYLSFVVCVCIPFHLLLTRPPQPQMQRLECFAGPELCIAVRYGLRPRRHLELSGVVLYWPVTCRALSWCA